MIQSWRAYFSNGLVQPPTSDTRWCVIWWYSWIWFYSWCFFFLRIGIIWDVCSNHPNSPTILGKYVWYFWKKHRRVANPSSGIRSVNYASLGTRFPEGESKPNRKRSLNFISDISVTPSSLTSTSPSQTIKEVETFLESWLLCQKSHIQNFADVSLFLSKTTKKNRSASSPFYPLIISGSRDHIHSVKDHPNWFLRKP